MGLGQGTIPPMAAPRVLAAMLLSGLALACAAEPERSPDPTPRGRQTTASNEHPDGRGREATTDPSRDFIGPSEFRAYPRYRGSDPDLAGIRLRDDLSELERDREVRAVLEIDRSYDLPELPLTAPTRDGPIHLSAILADVGIDLEIVWSDRLPRGELSDDPWPGEQRLRDVMVRYRNVPARSDQWHLYLLVGRKTRPEHELSLLIDPESRTAAVVFIDPSPAEAGATLHAIGHEIGHLLNLPHPWEAYGNTRSLMTYPWRWADWDWHEPAAFRFDAVGRRHILRDPEPFVRPGSSAFRVGAEQPSAP